MWIKVEKNITPNEKEIKYYFLDKNLVVVLQRYEVGSSLSVFLSCAKLLKQSVEMFRSRFIWVLLASRFYPMKFGMPHFSVCITEIIAIFIQGRFLFKNTFFNIFPPMQYRGCLVAVCKEWVCSEIGLFMLSLGITTSCYE